MNIRKIYEGWKNHLLPSKELKEAILSTHKSRMSVCTPCEFNSVNRMSSLRMDEHCSVCGCTLVALTKCLSCYCEKRKWKAVLTMEEEDTINEYEKSIDTEDSSSSPA
jgi:hypothetical protein